MNSKLRCRVILMRDDGTEVLNLATTVPGAIHWQAPPNAVEVQGLVFDDGPQLLTGVSVTFATRALYTPDIPDVPIP